jgi:hypothetical protein
MTALKRCLTGRIAARSAPPGPLRRGTGRACSLRPALAAAAGAAAAPAPGDAPAAPAEPAALCPRTALIFATAAAASTAASAAAAMPAAGAPVLRAAELSLAHAAAAPPVTQWALGYSIAHFLLPVVVTWLFVSALNHLAHKAEKARACGALIWEG